LNLDYALVKGFDGILSFKDSRASAEKFSGGGAMEKKTEKIAKIHRKIALLSFYLLYLYHV